MSMNDLELAELRQKVIEDEKLFRQIMFDDMREAKQDIKKLKSQMGGIKLIVAGFASFFGTFGAFLQKKLGG